MICNFLMKNYSFYYDAVKMLKRYYGEHPE